MATSTTTPKVGQWGVYTNSKGRPVPALVMGTTETIEEGSRIPVLDEGHVYVRLFGFGGDQIAPVPLRETIENIPDFTVEGKLVGFFEVS